MVRAWPNPTAGWCRTSSCRRCGAQELTLYGTGEQTRSFCYVDELVDGLMRLMAAEATHEPVNLGNPVEFTIRELADEVSRIVGDQVASHLSSPLPQDDPPSASRTSPALATGSAGSRNPPRRGTRADGGLLPAALLASSRLANMRPGAPPSGRSPIESLARRCAAPAGIAWAAYFCARRGSQRPGRRYHRYFPFPTAGRTRNEVGPRCAAPCASRYAARRRAPAGSSVISCATQPRHRQERALPGLGVAGDPDGQGGAPETIQQIGLWTTRSCRPYVSGIGKKMAAESERPNLPWEFHVVNDASVNAFAMPGGFIFVTRGLLTLHQRRGRAGHGRGPRDRPRHQPALGAADQQGPAGAARPRHRQHSLLRRRPVAGVGEPGTSGLSSSSTAATRRTRPTWPGSATR